MISKLKRQFPNLKILVLTMYDDLTLVDRAMKAGANGYVLKQEPTKVLLTGIHQILAGFVFLSQVSGNLLFSPSSRKASEALKPTALLTERELEVLGFIGKGIGSVKIGETLSLSRKTIDAHREKIKKKLNLKTSSELVAFASSWLKSEKKKPNL